MNQILSADNEVATLCRALDRRYSLLYNLADGPDGGPVHWSVVFDPESGMRMGLDDLADADLRFVGDWGETIRASAAHRRGIEQDPGITVVGDPGVIDIIGAAYAASRRVATVDVTFPSLAGVFL